MNYTYEAVYNRVATMADGTGTTTYAYHPVVVAPSPPQLGATQLASIDGPLSSDTITYGYDELGRGLSRAITCDALGRKGTVQNELGLFGYGYEGATNRVIVAGGEVSQATYTYHSLSNDRRLKQITNRGESGVVSDFYHAYLGEGKIYKIERQLPASSVDAFAYDAADQLTNSTHGTPRTYVYDPAGNRTQEVIAGATTDFLYNSSVNQMTSRSGAQGSATFSYDLNGSLTSDGTRTFEWDGANRLVAVNAGTHRSEFSYDGIGRRTRIVEKDQSVVIRSIGPAPSLLVVSTMSTCDYQTHPRWPANSREAGGCCRVAQNHGAAKPIAACRMCVKKNVCT